MEYEEGFRVVNEAVEEAIKLIKAEHAGANLDEARTLLSEAGEALKADRFEEAVELAKKAQLAAKPTTEYLLSRGKELASGAQSNFDSKSYEDAIVQWKKSLGDYGRARELAAARDEQEIIQTIAKVESTITKNISKAEVAIDNREMLKRVDNGNKSIDVANRFFNDKKFNEAKDAYEEARTFFNEALVLAETRDFEADKEKIKGAFESIEKSIEAALLSEGDLMLRSAEELSKKQKLEDSEKKFTAAVEFLSGLNIQRKELKVMLERGQKGIIQAKLGQGRQKMQAADQLFKNSKYYDAKEGYKAARAYLEGVLDEASGYTFTELVDELNNLIHASSQNISAATTALMDVGDVESKIIAVDSVGKGKAEFREIITENVMEEQKHAIKRETEFFNGFIRLKISVTNPVRQIISDVSLDLDYDENTLRLDRHEPEYPVKKGKVLLGTISPGTGKTVAFYLDPMTCTKAGTEINCRVDYKDAYGKSNSIRMESKKVKVVCPIFSTESDINIGMLKDFIKNLPCHDSKVYQIPTGLEKNKLIELCKESIQMHDVRHIRTLRTKDDKTCETWYYGKTKVDKNNIVINACINEKTESIEIFVATPAPESLTGLLAELGRSLTKKIKETGKKPEQIINVSIKDTIIQRSNLLNFCDANGFCIKENIIVEDSVIQKSRIGRLGSDKEVTGATGVNIEDNAVQRTEVSSARKCPNCGKVMQATDKFCKECGAKLG